MPGATFRRVPQSLWSLAHSTEGIEARQEEIGCSARPSGAKLVIVNAESANVVVLLSFAMSAFAGSLCLKKSTRTSVSTR